MPKKKKKSRRKPAPEPAHAKRPAPERPGRAASAVGMDAMSVRNPLFQDAIRQAPARSPEGFRTVGLSGGREAHVPPAEYLDRYNRALVEAGYAETRRDLKRYDLVDIRGLLRDELARLDSWQAPNADLDSGEKEYLVADYWYAFLPCFESGVMRVNEGRYVKWRLGSVDMESNKFRIWLQDYVSYKEAGWQPGIFGTVEYAFGDPATEAAEAAREGRRMKARVASLDGCRDYGELYRLLDVRKDLGWTEYEALSWEKSVVAYAARSGSEMRKDTGRDNLENLAALFLNYAAKCSYTLATHKIASSRRAPGAAPAVKTVPERENAAGAPKQPSRRVRTIGNLVVTSVEIPKPVQKRSAPVYRKIAWPVRAHVRTLASGKKIWIGKSERRRKCLASPGNAAVPAGDPVPVTLKLVKPENAGDAT